MTAKRGAGIAFSLDAASAARREAAGIPFTFTWKGETYSCPTAKEWPVTTAGVMSEGDLVGGLLLILGDEQGNKFLETGPTMGDVENLLEAIAKFQGTNSLGE